MDGLSRHEMRVQERIEESDGKFAAEYAEYMASDPDDWQIEIELEDTESTD